MGKISVICQGLTCADCSAKIEREVAKLPMVESAIWHMMQSRLDMVTDASEEELLPAVKEVVAKYEPDVTVLSMQEAAAHSHPHVAHTHGDGCEGHGCSCHAAHNSALQAQQQEETEEKAAQKKLFLRFVVGIALFLLSLTQTDTLKAVLLVGAYLIFGYDVLLRAVRNCFKGQVFDENFLMSLSTIGAFFIDQWTEAVFVMLFYQLGEAFQDHAVARSRKSIRALMDIRPDTAHLVTEDGVRSVSPEEVAVGDVIMVKAGEKIPLDGTVLEGNALLDTAALTGESLPVAVQEGSEVLSGSLNQDGVLRIRVEKTFAASAVMQILEMVEHAAEKKSETERFITRFARVYTPAVVVAAVLLAFVPTLLGMGPFTQWLNRALIFLVVSCPCALVLSVPLSYFAGIGAASAKGILIKGGNGIDRLAQVDTVVLDKTGTLTEGTFRVIKVSAQDQTEMLTLAAAGEAVSTHPIAKAIVRYYQQNIAQTLPKAEDVHEIGGYGIVYGTGEDRVLLGNARLMEKEGIAYDMVQENGTVVHVAKGSRYLGYLLVADQIRAESAQALQELRKRGVKQIVMLTGDREETAAEVANTLGLDAYHAQLLPQGKVAAMEKILEKGDQTVAFVGDGINDAPVLATADVGVAMGAIGTDAAIEAADVVLMQDDLRKLAEGIRISVKTKRIVHQNIVFALGVKAAVLLLGAVGLANLWLAVFADVGVAVLAVLNAMRKK